MRTLNYSKSNKNQDKLGKNGSSFWAFILSVFIYISIFYIFDLSPLVLFNTTKFWFFISNTLILIIAADFGAFSSSSKKQDYYYEEVKNNYQVRNHASFEFHEYHNKMVQKSPQKTSHEQPQEKIKDVIIASSHEKKLEEIVVKDDKPKITPKDDTKLQDDEKNKNERKLLCMRSKSERINYYVDDDEKKIIQRSQSERYDYFGKNNEKNEKKEEKIENEFSSMSDEELNRRVEEFITNFKGQIRLQAAARRNRQNLYAHHEV